MFDVNKIRDDFPMFKTNKTMQGKRFVYLDNAATSFKPQCVLDAISSYYTTYSVNSHRGDYDVAHYVDATIEEARSAVARFINADPSEVVFTAGTSMSINLLAYGYGFTHLKKEDEILITQAEHASNVLPWFKISELTGCKISYIPLTQDGKLTLENLEKSINEHTKLLCIAHVTNVLGYVNDIKAITKIAHKHNVLVMVDGAQSVPHIKTDVKDWDIDFLSFSGHKMCGPTGIGIMYGKFNLLTKTEPFLTGGGMNIKFDMCGDVRYLNPPIKFEAGTQNIAGIFGLKAAVEYLESIGMDNIQKYEEELRIYAIEKLKKNKNLIIYNPDATGGIITFNYKNVFAQDEATYLNSQGICVRSGQHCAKILMDLLGCDATVRASFYFYNSKEDIDEFVEALENGGNYLDAYFN
ncbi:MAG: SufS family cysteine desulfurase [Bacilli bacterium]